MADDNAPICKAAPLKSTEQIIADANRSLSMQRALQAARQAGLEIEENVTLCRHEELDMDLLRAVRAGKYNSPTAKEEKDLVTLPDGTVAERLLPPAVPEEKASPNIETACKNRDEISPNFIYSSAYAGDKTPPGCPSNKTQSQSGHSPK